MLRMSSVFGQGSFDVETLIACFSELGLQTQLIRTSVCIISLTADIFGATATLSSANHGGGT